MFRYGRRAGDHFHQPVGSLAILGDDDPDWKPTEYRKGMLGCEQTTAFRIVKLLGWRPRMAELEAGEILFGLFVCAHLETMSSRGDVPARMEAKLRPLANLIRRDIPEDDFRRWYRLIDWIMKLPEESNRIVWLRLEALKEPKSMSHVTFAEKYGHEKGLKEGRTEGLKEGRTEGLKEGHTEGLKDSLRELLLTKFPEEGHTLAQRFAGENDLDRLRALLRAAGLATSSEDFHARVPPTS